jgi:hypothetical protein
MKPKLTHNLIVDESEIQAMSEITGLSTKELKEGYREFLISMQSSN